MTKRRFVYFVIRCFIDCRRQFSRRKFQTFGSVLAVFCAKWREIHTISTSR